MVSANAQMAVLEEIANACETNNHFTHKLHKWKVCLHGHARINHLPKAKAQQNQATKSVAMVLSVKVEMWFRSMAKGQSTKQVFHLGLQQVQPRQSSKEPKAYNNCQCWKRSLVYIQRPRGLGCLPHECRINALPSSSNKD